MPENPKPTPSLGTLGWGAPGPQQPDSFGVQRFNELSRQYGPDGAKYLMEQEFNRTLEQVTGHQIPEAAPNSINPRVTAPRLPLAAAGLGPFIAGGAAGLGGSLGFLKLLEQDTKDGQQGLTRFTGRDDIRPNDGSLAGSIMQVLARKEILNQLKK